MTGRIRTTSGNGTLINILPIQLWWCKRTIAQPGLRFTGRSKASWNTSSMQKVFCYPKTLLILDVKIEF